MGKIRETNVQEKMSFFKSYYNTGPQKLSKVPFLFIAFHFENTLITVLRHMLKKFFT